MVLARKESTYIHEQLEEQKQPQINKNKKNKKSYRLEKFIVIASIATVFIFSILVLTRFTTITEAKHRVNTLQKQVEQLEAKKQKLRVEVEMVSKSRWIESEAKSRLNMDYPSADQMVYINVSPAKVAMLNNELNKLKNDYTATQKKEEKGFYVFFGKLIGYINKDSV